jgi:ATP-dependent DNA helicase RecQ
MTASVATASFDNPMTKEEVLKTYFGYDTFRPRQAEIIDAVCAGQNTLVLMPTGGGKSVCFQVPALVMPGLALVISPLIALMKDQVEGLQANGVKAAYLNSSVSQAEQSDVLQRARSGDLKFLYVSPERLFAGHLVDFLKNCPINLCVIDEAHCISSWGHDFRPEYRYLTSLKTFFPHVPVIALTATADRVTRHDILQQLAIEDARVFITSFDRPNLNLTVLPGRKRLQQIQNFIAEQSDKPGIIYCLSRKSTEEIADSIKRSGLKAACYHAGLPAETRSNVQEQFLKDDIQIIVATIAFGMGIDKSNIRWVIHYNLPMTIESFYQEIGRAGRDGLPAETLLFYSYTDVINRDMMINNSDQSDEQKELLRAKLQRMKQYAETDICRRRILLSYFNEAVETDCGNCDVCRNPRTTFDATLIAQKALSAVARTGQRVSMTMLIDVLRGSRNRHLLELGYQSLPTFGVGHDLRWEEWVDYIGQLLNSGFVDIAYDDGHAFRLNEASWQILKGQKKVELAAFIPLAERQKQKEAELAQKQPKQDIIRDALFERLRALRKTIADENKIPPYVVFSDRTLSDMAQKKPQSEAGMKAVSGIADEKFRRYGKAFMAEIEAFLREEDIRNSMPK